MKIDLSRMDHIRRIRTRELGGLTKMTDEHNALIGQRTDIKRQIADLEDNARHVRDPETFQPRLTQAKAALATVETKLISLSAALESARERSNTAGNLLVRCERFAETGRIA
ncbi:hypothetical protein EN794_028920 [Mesorhizobium sp. M00.F.Ca.ET.151.01.1.1]|nr:hypothetical protein EN794_028920 [Mesorhizobium sp. M00.F.Ca.ET.151.01.1.1]